MLFNFQSVNSAPTKYPALYLIGGHSFGCNRIFLTNFIHNQGKLHFRKREILISFPKPSLMGIRVKFTHYTCQIISLIETRLGKSVSHCCCNTLFLYRAVLFFELICRVSIATKEKKRSQLSN